MESQHWNSRLAVDYKRIRSRIVLLAPKPVGLPFDQVCADEGRHRKLLRNAQQLRGSVYLRDSAIEPWELSPSGRHIQAADDVSWHVLIVDNEERVTGCVRYRQHRRNVVFSELALSRSTVVNSSDNATLVRNAVQSQIYSAARRRLSYVELGGWAISEALRFSGEAVRMILSVYALAGLTGGALAVTTATTRHNSAAILKRMGGRPLIDNGREVPPYYDPIYGCEMELLEFDSTSPTPQFEALIEDYRKALLRSQLILPDKGGPQVERSSLASVGSIAEEDLLFGR